jgi:exopolysaccharide biosynthesis polyprenyl glycosylphosphotransferase
MPIAAAGRLDPLRAMPPSVSDTIPLVGTSQVPLRAPTARRQPRFVHGAGLLACLDSLCAVAAILVVLISVNLPHLPGGVESFLSMRVTVKNILLLIFLATAWPVVFHLFRLYHNRSLQQFGSEAVRVFAAASVGTILAVVFPLTSVSGSVTVADLRHFWLVSFALCLLVRTGRRRLDRARHPHGRRILIVGTGPLARRIYHGMRLQPPTSQELVGFVDEPAYGGSKSDLVREQTIGTLEDLEQILMRQVIDEVVIALPVKSCYGQIQHAIRVCERAGVQSKYGADLFESTVASPRYDAQGDRAFVEMQVAPDGYRLVVKRTIDVVGAAAALVIFAPLLLLVAVAIKLTSPGPVIYTQDRCGLNKRAFRMYKFRSMFADADKMQGSLEERNEVSGPVFKIRNDPRITPLGRLLRKSSVDELPQLWNILRGEMSLVGPRPLPRRDVHRIARPSDMRRFSMRPGLTCLWQVQGRSNLDFERWVDLDLEYIDSWSLLLDFRILARTIPAVLSGRGAS